MKLNDKERVALAAVLAAMPPKQRRATARSIRMMEAMSRSNELFCSRNRNRKKRGVAR